MPKHVIDTDRLMQPIAHFSHGARAGNTVYVGATAGTDATRRLAGTLVGRMDVSAQTRQMCANLQTALQLLSSGVAALRHVKLYVADMRDAPACTEMVLHELALEPGALTVVGSHGFPLPQAAIELDATAIDANSQGPRRAWLTVGSWATNDGAHETAAHVQAQHLLGELQAHADQAGFVLQDLVHMQLTVRDLADVAVFEEAFLEASAARPACTVVAAPLPDARMRFQLEAACVTGGGTPLAAPGAQAPLRCASAAVLAHDELFVSAQHGVQDGGQDNVRTQTLRAWQRVQALLDAAGLERAHLVRTSNVLADWRAYAEFNQGYGARVPSPYPPRTTVLGGLVKAGAGVQIGGVAHRGATHATFLEARHAND